MGLTHRGAGRWLSLRRATVVIAAVATVLSPAVIPITASAAGQTGGTRGADTAAISGTAPTTYASFNVRGGYTASGVGLRNRGRGTIGITGVPAGARVVQSYLFWSILGNAEQSRFSRGLFRGQPIQGTRVGRGAAPCWSGVSTGYAYRANVTALARGNGSFSLAGFASSRTDGADPFRTTARAPLAEGASLVVIYQKTGYPLTRVVIANGYGMTSAGALTKAMPFGFAASNPVGEVKTTFIGGDGQSTGEPRTRVNGVPVTSPDWDGTDRPLPRYSRGNLWDTDTISIGRFVRPGHRSATLRVEGGPDCISWVAQVLSAGYFGQADADGDKLLDGWEANGLDSDNNGTFDVPLGTSLVHKDLFVEMDNMGAETVCPCHLPLAADLNRIVASYAAAPFANNPDGLRGIRLHLDAGPARGAAYNRGGGNTVPFDADLNPVLSQFNAIKAANFSSARSKVYYYMIWAHGYDGDSSSGNAFAIPNDSFVVTLGLFPGLGTSDQKVGTFIHEFGHDLGLLHGGNDSVNFKPNYLSVMNYAYQFGGVLRTGATPPGFTYSSFLLPSLNEAALNESVGLGSAAAATYRTRWSCPSGAAAVTPAGANLPIDWNCNGTASGVVSADINDDDGLSVLGTQNNWASLIYGGGAVGGGIAAGSRASVTKEITYEEAKKLKLVK